MQVLKIRITNLTGEDLQPQGIVVDFEIASIGAIELELPNADIFGCYFHFNQAIWKHVALNALAPAFGADEALKKFMKKIMSIVFCP